MRLGNVRYYVNLPKSTHDALTFESYLAEIAVAVRNSYESACLQEALA